MMLQNDVDACILAIPKNVPKNIIHRIEHLTKLLPSFILETFLQKSEDFINVQLSATPDVLL